MESSDAVEIVLERTDEFGLAHRSELTIDKDLAGLSAGEIGFSLEDGKAIMAHLQKVVVKQQCEASALTRRFCTDCEGFRRIKDYSKRKIRTVFGRVEVRNPRIMNCQRCLPHFCDAWAVLRDICPDQATPELMERSARLGSLLPYRKAAEVMAEFLPIKPTESFVTPRHRTLKLGERLDERARERAWFEPPSTTERRQMELDLPNDPEREFVVSIDTAHVRASGAEAGRNFEIVVARCGRGGRGSRPGRYFTTADTSKRELQSRTLQALQTEGYAGRGEVTVLSDGAEIMKRLPQPTTHIIDWFHIAMKIQPLQQVADHFVRLRDAGSSEMAHVDANVRSLKWKLWHGQTDRALDQLETMRSDLAKLRERQPFRDTPAASGAPLADLCPFKQERDYQLRSPLSIRPAHRNGVGRVRREFAGRTTNGQKAADAMVKAGRSSSASGSGRRSQRRSSGAPRVQAAETSPSIEDRVAVRADTAAAQDGLTPQLIYRSQSNRWAPA
jgi:hypothetical protein